jgi:hypothetical protein
MTIKLIRRLLIGGALVIFLIGGIFAVYRLKNPATPGDSMSPDSSRLSPTRVPITGSPTPTSVRPSVDVDEHGCLTSDGYRYCEPKNKCLLPWKESCYSSVEEEIRYILADKYDKPVDQVSVTIDRQSGDYVGGSVLFGEGGPGEGGMFLARKVDDVWEVVFDGNGNVDCAKMRDAYGFPDSVLVPNFCD